MTIRFAIIGYGGMGSYHAQELMAKETAIEVAGIYDIDPQALAKATAQGLKTFASYEETLADETVEAVLIATPNDSHKALAIQALTAGKHVVCEKPVTLSTAELSEVLEVANKTQKVFMVHQNRRWDPDFLIVKRLVEERQIGEIVQLESRVQGANGIPGDWRHLKQHGGGMLLDWGVHLFDQIMWLSQSPLKEIRTDLSYILGDEVDDGFHSYLIFEDGLRVVIEVGTSNYTKLPRWYIKGLSGTARIDDWDLSGEIIKATGSKEKAPRPIQAGVGLTKTMAPPSEEAAEAIAFPEVPPTTSFYQNFYDVVRNDAEPVVKNEEVYQVLAMLETILAEAESHYESAATTITK